MAIKSRENLIGAYAFLIGVILALAIGILPTLFNQSLKVTTQYINIVYGILALSGIIVGFFNSGGRDSDKFLLASTSIVIVSYMGLSSIDVIKQIALLSLDIGLMLISTFNALMMLFIPATIIVALKTVFSISTVS